MNELENIGDMVKSCTRCDLCKTRTNAVPGEGPPRARIMFVGEAPGRDEDLKGRPFVGSAGRKLTEVLEKAGFTRDQVYITNVVKCRPPNNRIPSDSEQDMCKGYLEKEIKIINPKIICVMGNTASKSVLGQGEITKNHGKTVEKDGMRYFLTFHPAATIYNKELTSTLEDDIKVLAGIMAKLHE
jgi:DNA polymerase